MSAVVAAPELMAQAATDLATIDATLAAAHLTAAVPTQAVLPAAADEVSAGIAQLFSNYGQQYQGSADQAAAYHRRFVQELTSAAGDYAGAEATNVALLQPAGAGAIAAAIPSLSEIFDSIVSSLTQLLFDTLALLYYLGFFLLIPIYAALALYLPLTFFGSIFPGFALAF
jgi:hypothetical protein